MRTGAIEEERRLAFNTVQGATWLTKENSSPMTTGKQEQGSRVILLAKLVAKASTCLPNSCKPNQNR